MTKTYTLSNGTKIKVQATKNGIDNNAWGKNLTCQKYKVRVDCNGEHFYTTYRDSAIAYCKKMEVNIDVVADCILNDAYSYINCYNLNDFINEFGYDDTSNEALRDYEFCKRIYFNLSDMLSDEEFAEFNSIIQELCNY